MRKLEVTSDRSNELRANSPVNSIPANFTRSDAMPLGRLLFFYLWPFWLFKDASRGDRYARAAAYRHNRGMRGYLPRYLLRWLVSCGLILELTLGLDSLASAHSIDVFTIMATGVAILFTCSFCVLIITGYVYLYLSHGEE
jgi:hypothetical protein